jgi:hypothetical protein
MDRELVTSALRKREAGQQPTAQELAALRRYEKQRDEQQRWDHYRTVPKKHYTAMSGRQRKVLNEQADRYGIPCSGEVIDLGAVLRWVHDSLAKNSHRLSGDALGGPSGGAPDPADAASIEVLMSDKASALDFSRAAAQLAARRVARAARHDTLGVNEIESLKVVLQELRNAESDYLALQARRDELIPRDTVREMVGETIARCVRDMEILENSIATEFEVWLADPVVREAPADDRARAIREFVAKTCREVRQTHADGVDALLQAAKASEDESA